MNCKQAFGLEKPPNYKRLFFELLCCTFKGPRAAPTPIKVCLQLFLQFAFCFPDIKEHFQVKLIAGVCEKEPLKCHPRSADQRDCVQKLRVFPFSVWKELGGILLASELWIPAPAQHSFHQGHPSPTSPVYVLLQAREAPEFFFSFCFLKGGSGLM